jgi:hypothetical protein
MAVDYASQKALHCKPLSKTPGALTSADVLGFLSEVFDRYGLPRSMVMLAPSVWQSSHEMLLDDETLRRGEFLKTMDIEILPMTKTDKEAIRTWLRPFGLRLTFGEEYE